MTKSDIGGGGVEVTTKPSFLHLNKNSLLLATFIVSFASALVFMSALLFLFGINKADATEPSGGLFMYGADGSITFDITSAGNLEFGTTTGSKIGTATDQKLSFWNATPIIQPSGDVLTALSNLGLISSPTLSGLSASAVGTINLWASSTVPDGWILCDGASLLRAGTYAGLFAVIGTTYGSADGTHFNVPNFKGKVPVGYNSAETEFDVMGETGGEKTHTLTITEMPSHQHIGTPYSVWVEQASLLFPGNSGTYNIAGRSNANFFPATGGGGAHNNLQPYLTLNYIIKYAGAALPDSGLIVDAPLSGSGTAGSHLTLATTSSPTFAGLTVNGNVGIGTTNPNSTFEVAGAGGGRIIASDGGGADRKTITLQSPGGANYGEIFAYKYGTGAGAINLTFPYGNVGIGTVSPGSKLDVRDPGTVIPALGTVGTGLSILRTDGQAGLSIGYENTDGGSYIQSQRTDSANAYTLLLNPRGGNVGIGTTNPAGIFQVGDPNTRSGGMVFKTMLVNTGVTTTYFTATTIARFTGQVEMTCVSDIDPNRQIVQTVRLAYPSATATVINTSSQNYSAAWSVSGSNLQITLTGGSATALCTFRITGSTTSAGG